MTGAIMGTPRTPHLLLATGLTAMLLLTSCQGSPAASPAAEEPDGTAVNQAKLVPPLHERFEPWTCTQRRTGPVCTGELKEASAWEPASWPCAVPLWGRRTEHRHQRLLFDHDYRNYARRNRTHDVDAVSTSARGPAAATIRTRVRYSYDFDVPGDLDTVTQTSRGVLWDVRPRRGPSVFRAVGTLVEPDFEPASFSGRVTVDGRTTEYDDAPMTSFLTDELFAGWLCEAATGEPAVP